MHVCHHNGRDIAECGAGNDKQRNPVTCETEPEFIRHEQNAHAQKADEQTEDFEPCQFFIRKEMRQYDCNQRHRADNHYRQAKRTIPESARIVERWKPVPSQQSVHCQKYRGDDQSPRGQCQ